MIISRLTVSTILFSILATTSLALGAYSQHEVGATVAGAKPMRVIQLERVVVTAKRLPPAAADGHEPRE